MTSVAMLATVSIHIYIYIMDMLCIYVYVDILYICIYLRIAHIPFLHTLSILTCITWLSVDILLAAWWFYSVSTLPLRL